jgi:hypothetical protein
LAALVYAGMDKDENKQKVAITDLPPAEQKTIQDNLAGGTVAGTAKETKDGRAQITLCKRAGNIENQKQTKFERREKPERRL